MKSNTEIKYCECGCGAIVKKRFVQGHNKSLVLAREERSCKCGCGGKFIVKITSKKRYINGHNTKNTKHKTDCKCPGCKTKRKEAHKENCNCMACRMIRGETKGENCPFYNKKHTEESKLLMKENHADFSKENHPQFGIKKSDSSRRNMSLGSGGTGIPYENSDYPKEFNSSLKEQVRFRDNCVCQICGKSQLENGKRLDVHHIDYDKKNNKLDNLISLCHSCHTKTNMKRKYWKEYFKRREENGKTISKPFCFCYKD